MSQDEDTQRMRRPITARDVEGMRERAKITPRAYTATEIDAMRERAIKAPLRSKRFRIRMRYVAVQWLFLGLMSLALYYGRPVLAILAGLVSFVAFYGGLEYAATTEDS